jgi:hypothetical protein
MTLTLSNDPLPPGAPRSVNYVLDGPQHKILFSPFPRRIRAAFGGETITGNRNWPIPTSGTTNTLSA